MKITEFIEDICKLQKRNDTVLLEKLATNNELRQIVGEMLIRCLLDGSVEIKEVIHE
ncbi:hypothetical protein AB4259_00145 [Vibrio amylolyticus]|uniref:hypothetical protein n=1 Tax=Vibrio TaxID=662 RepID=UPI0012FFF500|nr:hypothetical protein [Vibrio sp. 10N.261.55.A7]